MNLLTEKIKAIEPKLIEYRRDFHQYPEPAWTEFRSASLIARRLEELGFSLKIGEEVIAEDGMMGVPSPKHLDEMSERAVRQGGYPEIIKKMKGGKTGVVAELDCGPGPVVALRFDMDSNDIQESDDPEHRPFHEGFNSKNPKAMHACGHDGHMTIGLGTAEILSSIKDELRGKVKLIFQPGEEGVRGARAMVEAGVVDDVDYIIGGHIGFKAENDGDFICATGKFLATTKLDITFKGAPAHAGAAPQEGRNALLAGATAALNAHAISRHGDGTTRINVGVLEAGQGRNIIPPNAILKLETRGENTELDGYMVKEVKKVAQAAALMYGVDYDIKAVGGTSSGESDIEIGELLKDMTKEMAYFTNVQTYLEFGAAEDFAHLLKTVQDHGGKGTYYMLGAKRSAGHHDSKFDFNEDCLAAGVEVNVRAVSSLLSNP